MAYRNHCNTVSERTYTGGAHQRIADLIAAGTHRVETWGNSREGFMLFLSSGTPGSVAISSGPYTLRRDAVAAARRAYGQSVKVARGLDWF